MDVERERTIHGQTKDGKESPHGWVSKLNFWICYIFPSFWIKRDKRFVIHHTRQKISFWHSISYVCLKKEIKVSTWSHETKFFWFFLSFFYFEWKEMEDLKIQIDNYLQMLKKEMKDQNSKIQFNSIPKIMNDWIS